ncbi:MAG: hypothetical protein R3C56_20115 [Pirellulaceae bacterium]
MPPKELPAKWKEEDTILGDFLRTAAAHRKEAGSASISSRSLTRKRLRRASGNPL